MRSRIEKRTATEFTTVFLDRGACGSRITILSGDLALEFKK